MNGQQPAMPAAPTRLFLGISVIWVPLAFVFDGVTVLMLPLRLGGDASLVGLVSLVGLGIAASLQPVAGYLSDRSRGRFDRTGVIVVGAAVALVGLWAFAGTTGLLSAVVGYVVVQVGATVIQAGQQTLIPEHVADHRRGWAAGLKTAFDVGGAFLAFAALGALLAAGSLVPGALAISVVLVAATALVVMLVPRITATAMTTASGRRILSLPTGLAPLIASRFLFLFATYAVGRFLVLLVAERLGIEPERAVDEAGWLLATFTLTTVLVAVPLGRVADRRPARDLMAPGAIVTALGIVALLPGAGLPGVVVGGLLMAIGTAAFVTGNWAATTLVVPAVDAGRLMAIANLGTGLAAAAAGALGPLIDGAGFAPALIIAAGAAVLSIGPLVPSPLKPPISQEHVT